MTRQVIRQAFDRGVISPKSGLDLSILLVCHLFVALLCRFQGPRFGRPGGRPPSDPLGGGMGSVKDRMAFFKKAAEDEKKAKEKQFVQKAPTPSVNRFNATTPTSPSGSTAITSTASTTSTTGSTGPTAPTSPTEKVSLKKAPDPNKA